MFYSILPIKIIIYFSIMHQHDTFLWEVFVIAYAINIQPKTSKYIITQMKSRTKSLMLNFFLTISKTIKPY
jgi:hypothetical protein